MWNYKDLGPFVLVVKLWSSEYRVLWRKTHLRLRSQAWDWSQVLAAATHLLSDLSDAFDPLELPFPPLHNQD